MSSMFATLSVLGGVVLFVAYLPMLLTGFFQAAYDVSVRAVDMKHVDDQQLILKPVRGFKSPYYEVPVYEL